MARKQGLGFKMKGSPMARNFGISPMKDKPKGKPTKEEIFIAANDPSIKKDADYYAWKVGGKFPTTYHGAGGKIMNEDGTVNEKLTNRQLASYMANK